MMVDSFSWASTEQEVTWRNLTSLDIPESVLRGIEQAAKGEGVEIDPNPQEPKNG